MTALTYLPAVRDYARAVRAALTGLDPQQVQGLTDGLEADLVDALADQAPAPDAVPAAGPSVPPADGLVRATGPDGAGLDEAGPESAQPLTFDRMVERFGPAQQYADDLRAGAGLPPRIKGAPAPPNHDAEALGSGANDGTDGAGGSGPDGPGPAGSENGGGGSGAADGGSGAVAGAGGAGPGGPTARRDRGSWREALGGARRSAGEWARTTWWWSPAGKLGRALRPVWWAARGLVVLAVVYDRVYYSFSLFGVAVVFCLAVGGSMALGRVNWRTKQFGLRLLLALFNIAAAYAFLLWSSGTLAAPDLTPRSQYWEPAAEAPPEGDWQCRESGESALCLGGELVTNVFAFDAEGNLLEGVQLFDSLGRPLTVWSVPEQDPNTFVDWEEMERLKDQRGDVWIPSPAADAQGQPLWNVFPLGSHVWRLNEETGTWEQVDAGEQPSVQPFPWRVGGSVDRSSLPGANATQGQKDGEDAKTADKESAPAGDGEEQKPAATPSGTASATP
jgi:hypothetical protein